MKYLKQAVQCFVAAMATVAGAQSPGQLLDHQSLSRLHFGEHVVLTRFPLGTAGEVTLDLERFSVLAPDAIVVEATARSDHPLPANDLVLLKGVVVGEDDDSLVFVGVGRFGVHGFVSRENGLWWISTGPYTGVLGPEPVVRVTDASEMTDPMPPFCGVSADDPIYKPPHDDGGLIEPEPLGIVRGAGCELAQIAVDTDWEFTANLFGANTSAAAEYALTLHGAVSTIYERDVGVAHYISFLRVWGEDVDPYGGEPEMGAFLNNVRNHWVYNMQHIPRVVTHALSGRPLGGGVAWVNVLCSNTYGYGISSVAGYFPVPLTDHQAGNWDPFVVAHEIGHNFGTGHTHDSYDPVIDGCGLGDCSAAWGGTIMSYCHGCPGGMANIVLAFHPRVQEVIEATVANAGCFTHLDNGAMAVDDRAETLAGFGVTIDVLDNDIAQSCGVPTIVSVQSPSDNGGTVEIVSSGEHDQVRYTPPAGFVGVDSFTYTIDAGQTATVQVGAHTLRQPDQPANPQPGIEVDYYFLLYDTQLPDFDTLTPVSSDVVPSINYPETEGTFATSGFTDLVGAVFEGYVSVDVPGLYTFEIESDDGSAMFLGDQQLLNNDGLHDMQAVSGVVGLLPGMHRVRIEYFERRGPCGLIVRWARYPHLPAPITADAWFHAAPACPADLNEDGSLDFFDLQLFLNWYAAGDLHADFVPDGRLDFFDLQAFLGAFVQGCG